MTLLSNINLLKVDELSISFVQYQKGLRQRVLKVINNLDISIDSGEILAVVGSSGSGKSLLAHAILGILPSNAICTGKILYADELLTQERQKRLRGSEITLVPQSVNFLDPLMRVSAQVRTAVRQGNPVEVQKKIFSRYGLDERVGNLYPFQLSGGMARRVLISAAVINGAKLIIADEPTPGLHPEIVAETLNHLRELANEGCGVMLITHDISTALQVADKIAVFYAGTTVEIAPAVDFHGQGQELRHPYSQALWKSLPQNDFTPTPGFQPSLTNLPEGCLFAPRCEKMTPKCTGSLPVMRDLRSGRVRCHHAT